MPVTVKFCGAARTVTGSCFLFETEHSRVLVDCGLFQGSKTLKELNYGVFPFRPTEIGAILLTHGHIDHSGLLPKLVRAGYRGSILATRGTIDLCSYMLPDSGAIQESEVDTLNRRNAARHRPAAEPIYTRADAIAMLDRFRPVDYEAWSQAASDIRARFWNAGHLLGSASIELEFASGEATEPIRVLVSGDLGPDAKLLQPGSTAPADFDYVIVESTYGDVDRPTTTRAARRERLATVVREAAGRKGALLIPSFAVERAQELVFDLLVLMSKHAIPACPIFLDSPLAIRATEVFCKHTSDLENGSDVARAFRSPHLRFIEAVQESQSIENISGFHIIVAGSGMCDAGRIRYHLKHWLWNNRATVLLVGFQAQGTLGRFLHDGEKAVRIQGEEIKVAAQIRSMDEYSGHADGPELARWIGARRPIRRGLFLVHGEEPALTALQMRVAEQFVPEAKIFKPVLDDIYDLSTSAPTSIDGAQRRRLTSKAVINLDWHNEMSRLILDINDRIESAADDRARGVIIRRLQRALVDQSQ